MTMIVTDQQDGGFSYQYQLRPGINRKSHAIVRSRPALPGMIAKWYTDKLESCHSGRYAPIFHPDSYGYPQGVDCGYTAAGDRPPTVKVGKRDPAASLLKVQYPYCTCTSSLAFQQQAAVAQDWVAL